MLILEHYLLQILPDFGILRVVVDNPKKEKKYFEDNNFSFVKVTDIIAIELNDIPGGLATVLKY